MKNLQVPSCPGLPSGLVVPDADLVERFCRSPGPGGQSVNTSYSRVELEYDVRTASTLTDTQRRVRARDDLLHDAMAAALFKTEWNEWTMAELDAAHKGARYWLQSGWRS